MLRKCEDLIHILAHKKTHLQKNFVSAFYSCSLFITQKTLQFQSLYQESLLLSEIYFPPPFYALNRWSAFMFNSRATFLIIAQFLQQSQLSFYCWYLPFRLLSMTFLVPPINIHSHKLPNETIPQIKEKYRDGLYILPFFLGKSKMFFKKS